MTHFENNHRHYQRKKIKIKFPERVAKNGYRGRGNGVCEHMATRQRRKQTHLCLFIPPLVH